MSKRRKFILAASILLIGLILSRLGIGQFLQWRFRVLIYIILSVITTVWALRDEDFFGIEWLTLPILPSMFAISTFLIHPLLPTGFDSVLSYQITADTSLILATAVKIIFYSAFVVGYYATVLTANIKD
ncbi:hypothetical protein HY310_01815 [Candidatus Microgenomates bacterium]|nr:hypothetical protein [Candidatus Microgenomates bacterium]